MMNPTPKQLRGTLRRLRPLCVWVCVGVHINNGIVYIYETVLDMRSDLLLASSQLYFFSLLSHTGTIIIYVSDQEQTPPYERTKHKHCS